MDEALGVREFCAIRGSQCGHHRTVGGATTGRKNKRHENRKNKGDDRDGDERTLRRSTRKDWRVRNERAFVYIYIYIIEVRRTDKMREQSRIGGCVLLWRKETEAR